MTRNEFLKTASLLGLSIPFASLLFSSCDREELSKQFTGKVIIVGAGAAGMTAGFLLNKHNIDFEILEASSVFGGRVKRVNDFADFPIDLGGEWIHENPSVLTRILQDKTVSAAVDTIVYNPQKITTWHQNQLMDFSWASFLYKEFKFKNTTWFGFFEQFMVPFIESRTNLNSPVASINYTSDKVLVTDIHNREYVADKVIVTVPTTILKNNVINFSPDLPIDKLDALRKMDMPAGLKVFVEFAEKFYPDIVFEGDILKAFIAEDKVFYDAAFKKDSNKNILGLFTIGDKAAAYTMLDSDEAILEKVIAELDTIFDGKASQNYMNHVIQNWSKEPHIQGSYTFYNSQAKATIATMKAPIDDKIYFAGEAFSANNGATVPGACESAYEAVESILSKKLLDN